MNTLNGTILVTGATGFVGRHLCNRLLAVGGIVRGTLLPSENATSLVLGVEPVVVEPLGPDTAWRHALVGIETVIHLAARVHIMDDPVADPLTAFRRANTEGTAQLAREAAEAGVKRLVFISSIKVNGEESIVPYSEDSLPQPVDPYGISKWEAEQALRRIESDTGIEVVVIRPTLVYGPGVKANFLGLMKIVRRGFPLPFACIKNSRSLIYIGNLVDALATCAVHPAAAGQTFLVSDGEDVSVPELIRRIALALSAPERLFSVPVHLMRVAGWLTSKSAEVNRLTGSLTIDSTKIRQQLGWKPPFTMEEGLRETVRWFVSSYG